MTEEQQQARAERRAICECESVPEEEIHKIFLAYKWIFGIEDKTEIQELLIETNSMQNMPQ